MSYHFELAALLFTLDNTNYALILCTARLNFDYDMRRGTDEGPWVGKYCYVHIISYVPEVSYNTLDSVPLFSFLISKTAYHSMDVTYGNLYW